MLLLGEEDTELWQETNKKDYHAPTVLLVERIKPVFGQPWYHKETTK